MLRTSIDTIKENSFKLTKERSRRYLAKTITDADYADDIVLPAKTPTQAKTLLHSLKWAAAGISLHVNAHKMEYMCFNQTGNISTLNSSTLKLVDKFTYLGSSVTSTKTDINTQLAKAWIAINRLSVIWKSDLTDKRKRSWYCYMDAPHGCWLNGWRKSLTAISQECCEQYWTSPGDSTPQSSSYMATYHPSRKLSKLDEPNTRDTAGEVGMSSWVMYSCGPLHMDEQRQDIQFKLTYSSSVPVHDVALRISRKQWTIGRCGERGSGISMLIARLMMMIIYTHIQSQIPSIYPVGWLWQYFFFVTWHLNYILSNHFLIYTHRHMNIYIYIYIYI